MSKHNDLIMELLDEILRDVVTHDEEEKHEEEKPHKEPPTETKGFESLVSAEEYEAIKELKKALDNCIDVHNNNVMLMSSARKIGNLTPYARIQYSILSDVIGVAVTSINIMHGIHVFDKESIDEMVKEHDCDSVEELERELSMMLLAKKMKG